MSRPPEDSVERFQASAETRAECPRSCRTCFTRSASQIWTCHRNNKAVGQKAAFLIHRTRSACSML